MSARRLRTAAYSDEARRRLGDAVVKAREAAGYKFRTTFAKAADIRSMRSLELLEAGDPGVGQSILFAVARALPGWTEDTPREILEGGLIPPLPDTLARIDSTTVGAPEVSSIFDADDDTLLAIIQDRDKIGTNEWLEALGILLADDKITKEAYVHALTVGRKVRQARKEAEQKIADLQQSLTQRVRADLSE